MNPHIKCLSILLLPCLLSACSALNPTNSKSILETVYTIPITGGDASRVVPLSLGSTVANYRHARWSPDGTQLVLYSVTNGEIYSCTTTGNTLTNLTNTTTITESDPAWSPSGTSIAYLGTDYSGISGLYVMTAAGSSQTRIMAAVTAFGWSTDSTLLWAQSTNGRLYIISASGGSPISVGTLTIDSGTTPVWMDSSSLRFVSGGLTYIGTTSGTVVAMSDTTDGSWGIPSAQVFVDESTGYWVSTTGNLQSLGTSDWTAISPNGARIAVAVRGAVYSLTPSVPSRHLVYDTQGQAILKIEWAPDNSTVLIYTTAGIFVASYDGTNVLQLSAQSSDAQLSEDGSTIVFIGSREESR